MRIKNGQPRISEMEEDVRFRLKAGGFRWARSLIWKDNMSHFICDEIKSIEDFTNFYSALVQIGLIIVMERSLL